MRLCVGAASRRVVEEAATLQVAQIVASRRQVGELEPGYTGYTSKTLVESVRELSRGATLVVRDHGGPYQNGDLADDWQAALDADADAGFDVLHIDVSNLPRTEQPAELARLCERYAGRCGIEVGGERDEQAHLLDLLDAALTVCRPRAAVIALGGHIHADRQYGHLIPAAHARPIINRYHVHQVTGKAHNLDWLGGRQSYDLGGYYNVAPEFGNVEADAWLRILPAARTSQLLHDSYATDAWRRWFGDGEGTMFERARCALRYRLEDPDVAGVLAATADSAERYVRDAIADAIRRG